MMKKHSGLIEFIAVVNYGSFTAAAEALDMSTSFVSRKVSGLEADLGMRLLNRSTRRVNLTDIGSQYYEKTVVLLAQLDELEADLTSQQKQVVGDIKITAGGIFGENEIALALADFAIKYSQVNIHFDVSSRKPDLAAEGYDLAIRHGAAGEDGLVSRKLTSRRMIVCATPEYFERYGKPKLPQDLLTHNCLISRDIPWFFEHELDHFELKISGNWSSNNGKALANSALQGLGIIRLAETYIKEELQSSALEGVLQNYEVTPSVTYLVYPERKYLPYRMRALIDFLVDRFKN